MASKLYLTSYAAHGASDNLHPSVAGGNWVLVAEFQKDEDAKKAAQNISIIQNGALPGPNSGSMVVAVIVKTA